MILVIKSATAAQYPGCAHVSSGYMKQRLKHNQNQETIKIKRTMTPTIKFDVLGSFQSCLIFTAIELFLFASFGYNFPKPSHMIFRYDFISGTTEHEYWGSCRDKWDFGCRIPFLVTQKRKGAENWKCVWYKTGKRGKRIFEYQGIYLSRYVNFESSRFR